MIAPPSNTIIKFADNTVFGLIADNNEQLTRLELAHLVEWCENSSLVLNTNKTKEFRRTRRKAHLPLHIHGGAVESVERLKFLGVTLSDHLTWTSNTSSLVKKKAQQRPFFLGKLKQAQLPVKLLLNLYRTTILTNCITAWYRSCTAAERKDLHRVAETAQRAVRTELPHQDDVCTNRLRTKTSSITSDTSHPGHRPFELLPSGKRYRTSQSRTRGLRNSFFLRAVATIIIITPLAPNTHPPQ